MTEMKTTQTPAEALRSDVCSSPTYTIDLHEFVADHIEHIEEENAALHEQVVLLQQQLMFLEEHIARPAILDLPYDHPAAQALRDYCEELGL